MSGILYRLDFASGKSYIGVTRASLASRLRRHRYLVRSGSGNAVHEAWRKYGAPAARSLAVVEDRLLEISEQRAVAAYGTRAPSGYNLTPGGDVSPSLMPEVRRKISVALTGIRRSEKTRALISLAQIGRVLSEEHKAKTSRTLRGRSLTAEHKRRIGDANRGRSCERWRGAKNPMQDRVLVERLAQSKRGRPLSEEHRRKLRAAWVIRRNRKSV